MALVGALTVVATALACGDGRSAVGEHTAVPGTPSAVPAASLTPTTAVTVPQRHVVPNGGMLPSENGLLYIRLDTGEMEFWAMPGPYGARPISRDGRWVVWGAQGVSRTHLLDTHTGLDRVLTVSGEPAGAAGFSGDGQLLFLVGVSRVALVETESGRVLAEAPSPPGNSSGAAEFAPDGAAATGFAAQSAGSRTTVILRPNGSALTIDGGTWPIRWSRDGIRLAVSTATGLWIVSAGKAPQIEIPLGGSDRGYNPRWSPDGRYLATANGGNTGGQRVFDAATGEEVLRAVGTPTCIGDYWFEDGTLAYGWEGRRVAVPSGEIREGLPARPRNDGYRFDDAVRTPGITRLLLANGAAVEFQSSGMWSVPYDGDGIYGATTDGRALFLVGIGGKGICDSQFPEPSVQLPPFAQ